MHLSKLPTYASIKTMKYIFLFVGIGLAQIVPFDQTLPVLTSPVVQAKAGQDLHFQ
jgi:hypothetical protein